MSDVICQDCGQPSDLGNKCRACYAKWQRQLYADIPDRQGELIHCAKELNKLDDTMRKAVAEAGLGMPPDVPVKGHAAELLVTIKHALGGPFGDQMKAKLQAIHNALSAKAAKKSKSGGTFE